MTEPVNPCNDECARSPRVAVVTGGQGVLGSAVAGALSADGWQVHAPGHAELDVANPDAVRAWFARLDRCDLLVNNAGLIDDALLARMTEEQWDRVMASNLSGSARCAQAV